MPKSFPTILNRITFITKLIMENDSLTLQDIDSRWKDSVLCDGSDISGQQFCRDRDRIEELFGLYIKPRQVDKNVYAYYVKDRDKFTSDRLLRWSLYCLIIIVFNNSGNKLASKHFLYSRWDIVSSCNINSNIFLSKGIR